MIIKTNFKEKQKILDNELKWLNNLHEAWGHCGFSAIIFVESLIEWVEKGNELTNSQASAAHNIAVAIEKYLDRIERSYEYDEYDYYWFKRKK